MKKHIDYYFMPISPWAYLGHERFDAIVRKHGATVGCKPADFGRVFAASGTLPLPQRPKQRQTYRIAELERWREHLGVPLNIHPKYFPTPVETAMRMIIAAGPDAMRFTFGCMRACWAEERNLADAGTLLQIAAELGLDGPKLLAAAEGPETKAIFEANTEEAIARQVFGAPTYIYNGELFWGQDRLDFVDRALAR